MPFFLPWHLFQLIDQAGEFGETVHGENDDAADFWGDYMLQEYAHGHSVHETKTYHPLEKTTPLHVHIDGVKKNTASGYGS